jgi:hypothetical protein
MATVLANFTALTAAPSDPQRPLTGCHSFALCAGQALCAAALAAIMIKDDDAAATMRPKHAPTRPVPVPATWGTSGPLRLFR